MDGQNDIVQVKSNLLKIQKICQESLQEINLNNNSDILLFLDRKNKEIIKCCGETESTLSVHRREYMSSLNELKNITDSISEKKL